MSNKSIHRCYFSGIGLLPFCYLSLIIRDTTLLADIILTGYVGKYFYETRVTQTKVITFAPHFFTTRLFLNFIE